MVDGVMVRYVLLTDIAGSSRLWEQFPDAYPAVLEAHNDLTESVVVACGGTIVKNLGDGYLAHFEQSDAALAAAVQLQIDLGNSTQSPLEKDAVVPRLPDGTRLALRAVVHGGVLQQLPGQTGDWFGPALNRTARIAALAHGSQTLMSEFVRQRLGELPHNLELRDLGYVRLRDLGEPEHLYQVRHQSFAEQDFPALLGMDARPNNFLAQPTAFIGREAELAELGQMLAETRLLTLQGPGGYGKSRLAAQVAAQLLERFRHGAFFVELALIAEPSQVAEAIAAAVGLRFFSSRDPQQQLLDYLRSKELLLVLDNLEQLLSATPLVSDLLKHCPQLHVLATSRERLRLAGEVVYDLRPLPVGSGSASVQLFADRALHVRRNLELSAENLAWIEQICSRLEGVPLAIELAAAWVDSFTLPEMLAELGRQVELTARLVDVPERQRSVRASCDWSWNLLTAGQELALMQTACFRGGFFLDAAESVLGVRGMALRELLAGLRDKSWLDAREVEGQLRYWIRDALLHDYARQKLGDVRRRYPELHLPEEQAGPNLEPDARGSLYEHTTKCHLAHFLARVQDEGRWLGGDPEREGARQLTAVKRLGMERHNLMLALETAVAATDSAAAAKLMQCLHKLLMLRSEVQLLLGEAQLALRGFESHAAPALELEALLASANAELRTGHRSGAHTHATRALHLAEQLGYTENQALAMILLGKAEHSAGNKQQAMDWLERAFTLAQDNEFHHRASVAACMLGNIRFQQDYAAARRWYLLANEAQQKAGHLQAAVECTTNLALVEMLVGNVAEAEASNGRALQAARMLGNQYTEAYVLQNIAALHEKLGRKEEAVELLGEALVILDQIGETALRQTVIENMASLQTEELELRSCSSI